MYGTLPDLGEPLIKQQLQRLQDLVEGTHFLAGLGRNSTRASELNGFIVIDDLKLATDVMTSQEIWDLPEPWPYQYFLGEYGDEVSKFEYGLVDNNRRMLVSDLCGKFMNGLGIWQLEHIRKAYELHGVISELEKKFGHADVEWLAGDVFVNEIGAYLHALVHIIFLTGDLGRSPFFVRLFEAFETGGIPCGWAGDTPHQCGADPMQCMRLFHLVSH